VTLDSTSVNKFDIVGEKDGYVGIIRLDDVKLLLRKEPQMVFV
jgi:hypothetical protein